jgi:hypothetical protein
LIGCQPPCVALANTKPQRQYTVRIQPEQHGMMILEARLQKFLRILANFFEIWLQGIESCLGTNIAGCGCCYRRTPPELHHQGSSFGEHSSLATLQEPVLYKKHCAMHATDWRTGPGLQQVYWRQLVRKHPRDSVVSRTFTLVYSRTSSTKVDLSSSMTPNLNVVGPRAIVPAVQHIFAVVSKMVRCIRECCSFKASQTIEYLLRGTICRFRICASC